MKRTVMLIALASLTGGVVLSQDNAQLEKMRVEQAAAWKMAGGTLFPQEAGIFGDVVKGAPFSGKQTEAVNQTLGDGTHITRSSTVFYSRDSQGRVRREDDELIVIFDPVSGVSYRLNKKNQVGSKSPLVTLGTVTENGRVSVITRDGEGYAYTTNNVDQLKREAQSALEKQQAEEVTRGAAIRADQEKKETQIAAEKMRGLSSRETHESLGTQVVNGVMADGTRVVNITPAGLIGNDRPMQSVIERWYSPDLHIMVLTRRTDPRDGEIVTQFTDIQRGEPNPSLFQVPAGYTIREGRR